MDGYFGEGDGQCAGILEENEGIPCGHDDVDMAIPIEVGQRKRKGIEYAARKEMPAEPGWAPPIGAVPVQPVVNPRNRRDVVGAVGIEVGDADGMGVSGFVGDQRLEEARGALAIALEDTETGVQIGSADDIQVAVIVEIRCGRRPVESLFRGDHVFGPLQGGPLEEKNGLEEEKGGGGESMGHHVEHRSDSRRT